MKPSHYNFSQIIAHFSIEEKVTAIKPYGSGHINGTYHLQTSAQNSPGYLLQLVNSHVFKDVEGLIKNILTVTSHIRQKLAEKNISNAADRVLDLVPTRRGAYFYQDPDGNYWRVYVFIKNTKSYDQANTLHQAYQTGFAFGQFQSLLTELDASLLTETIPNFHHIDDRMANLNTAVKADYCQRLSECVTEIDFINEHHQSMRQVITMYKNGKLPLRIIHNDTKFNNVLLDENDNAQCVIDLDTVMPGLVAYDFGDAIRTIINTAPEDEPDLSKIDLNLDLFEAYTKGYFEQASHFLTENEIISLTPGVLLLPFIQAVRFLTDFLEGDHYFKTHLEHHNLQRARAQLQLVKKLRQYTPQLNYTIYKLANRPTIFHSLSTTS